MPQSYQDKLFDYVGDLIYKPQNARLCVADFPPEYKRLAEGLQLLGQFLSENRAVAEALCHGQLKDLPTLSPDNNLAAPLKDLHAILKHITWQTQQVANGDYSQQLDFMDDFSAAFNEMTAQLKEREAHARQEAETAHKAAIALHQSQALLMNLAFDMRRSIVVLGRETGETLFLSPSAQDFSLHFPKVATCIHADLQAYPAEHGDTAINWERSFISNPLTNPPEMLYFSISSQPIVWEGKSAYAHILEDVTQERENELEMRRLAYRDALTDVYNRRYGMSLIAEYETEHLDYCISFIDIDYLKHCNDTYGHDAGNSYILSVTTQLQKFGHESVLCRIGGDEFMLITKNMPAEQADRILAELRAEFEQKPLDWDTGRAENPQGFKFRLRLPHSFSYGSCNAGGTSGRLSSEALSLADERMYQFKFAAKKLVAEANGVLPEDLSR